MPWAFPCASKSSKPREVPAVFLPSDISGHVFEDCNNNGVFEPVANSEEPIAGVTVTLSGTEMIGQAVSTTTTTGADGSYSFTNLQPGTYQISEPGQPTKTLADGTVVPYLDGKTHVGTVDGVTTGTGTTDNVSNVVIGGGDSHGRDYDFGEVYSQLSGNVFLDLNQNGIQEANEPGIAGVTVSLIGTNDQGAVSLNLTTDAQGNFTFANLRPGSYQLVETQPAGFVSTINTAGSAGGTVNGDTIINVPLDGCTEASGYKFGEVKPSPVLNGISGFVFEDCNNNGVRDPGEEPIAGAVVSISGLLGPGVDFAPEAVTTDVNGFYQFNNLPAGTYTITEGQPAGFFDGKDSIGTPFVGVAGINGNTVGNDILHDIVIPTSTVSPTGVNYDFAEVAPESLSGFVYLDANKNGVRDIGDSAIAGVTLTLTGVNDIGTSVSVVATSGADGSYSFGNLRPGMYAITEVQPPGFLEGTDNAGTPYGGDVTIQDVISNINLNDCQSGVNYNFGETQKLPKASLSGFVFEDCNDNGVFEPIANAEEPIAGATVVLTGTDNNGTAVSATTTTSSIGFYIFTDLNPGTYSVAEPGTLTKTLPDGTVVDYLDGKTHVGTAGGVAATDLVSGVTLTANAQGVDYDFGEVYSQLSGSVFFDKNANGQFEPNLGETPLAGVTVALVGTNDQGQAVSIVATTNSQGQYTFANLRPGNYSVVETEPAGFTSTINTAGSAGGTVNGDTILNVNIDGCTIANGYNFGENKPTPVTNSISGKVFEDCDIDGIFNDANQGLAGVTLTLTGTDSTGAAVSLVATTDANGNYTFSNLAAGTYQIVETVPTGFFDSGDAVGTPFGGTPGPGGLLVGADTFNEISQIVIPTNRVTQTGVNYNFADVKPDSLAGTAYLDANNDGVFDAGDTGEPGITLTLTGVNDLALPVSVAVTSGTDGTYSFGNLRPGHYSITETVPASLIPGTNTPGTAGGVVVGNAITSINLAGCTSYANYNFGFKPKPVVNSISGNVFEDCDDNGVEDGLNQGIAGVTLTLTGTDTNGAAVSLTTTTDANGTYQFTNLNPGTYQIAETQPVGFIDGKDTPGTPFGGNNTVNDVLRNIVIPNSQAAQAGIEYNFAELKPSSLSGFVFVYSGTPHNLQPDSPQIAGTTITLTGTNDLGQQITATTLTGQVPGQGNGYYEFTNLRPGTYAIVETEPKGFPDTPDADFIGTQGGTVSDDRFAVNLMGCTAGTQNNFGETTGNVSPGSLAGISGFVYWDKNCSGTFDAADVPIPGTIVTLTGRFNSPDAFGDTTTIASTTTDANGFYLFNNLPTGTYSLVETQPAGFIQARDTFGTPFAAQLPVQDQFVNIVIPDTVVNGTIGVNYDYGERTLSKQDFLGSDEAMPCSPLFGVQSDGAGNVTTIGGGGVQGEVITQQFFNPITSAVTVTGSSTSSIVRVQNATTGQLLGAFYAFDSGFAGGVNVATGDLNKDGVPDIAVGAGAGGGPAVKVFNGVDGTTLDSFFAFDPGFTGGVSVAVADVNGDGVADLIVAAGAGGGPHVKVIDGTKLNQLQANGEIADSALIASFFAFDSTDANFSHGVNVAAGDVNGDGKADIIVGARAGGTPEVRVFSVAGGLTVLNSFNAYAASFTGGVSVAAADVDGDGKADIVTGAGTGGGPEVKVLRGTDLATLADFFAYESTFTGGIRVGAADLTGDGKAEVFVAPASGSPRVRLFEGVGGAFIREYLGADSTSIGGLTIAGGAPTVLATTI